MSKETMVTYTGDNEVLVCAIKDEHKLLADYFAPDCIKVSGQYQRDIDLYNRDVCDYVAEIRSGIHCWPANTGR